MVEDTSPAQPPEERSLSSRASSATVWVIFARFAQQIIGFARILVLARLLAPDDFGLMGVAISALAVSQLFAVTGFLGSLVQRQGDISHLLNTVWTIELVKNLLIAGILFTAASSIAGFLNTPEATPILQSLAGIFAILGLKNIGIVYLRRQLRVRDEMAITLGSTFLESIVTIILAFTLGTVWALVWGALARSVSLVAISYIVYPYMPRLEFKKAEAVAMFKFARWLSLTAMTLQLIHQLDRLIVAKVLGTMALGFYTVSDRFSLNPVRELGRVGVRVGYPALSTLQANITELRRKSLSTLELSMSVIIPIAATSSILVEEFVPVILGDQWTGAIDVTRVLIAAAIPMTIVELGAIPLVAYGVPKASAGAIVVALITMLITMPLFSDAWGLQGAGSAMALSYGIASLIMLASWRYWLGIRFRHMAKAFLPGLILAAATALPLYAIDSIDMSNLVTTIVGAVMFVAIYGAVAAGLWFTARKGPFQFLVAAFSRKRKSKPATA